ncbi:hypothetical protein [Primorskyibacter sedentarius]|uniref:hypothetical protein n=1 Tax=Primorskyibacter sedentarius TaxID=745311 RepID=UPI003EB9FE44
MKLLYWLAMFVLIFGSSVLLSNMDTGTAYPIILWTIVYGALLAFSAEMEKHNHD